MHTNIIKVFFPHIVDDDLIDAIMAHVTESVREFARDNDLTKMRRRKAQERIEEAACLAVTEMWTEAFRRPYKPNKSWPRANAILLENPHRVVIELWIGHEYHSSDIPEPIEIFFDGEK